MYASIYFHQNTTLPPKFPCKSSTLCLPQRMRRGTIFSHKITTQPATTNCHMLLLLLLHAIHTHLVTPRSLLSRSLYSWNHKRQQQQRQHKYATDNEKQLFCQRLIQNYWEFLFFSYKCSLTQFSFSFQIFFVVLKRTDWLIFLWNYTMVCILLLFHSIIPSFEII